MKQTIKYRRKTITLDVDYLIRKKICSCCGRKGKTDLHHWHYAYPTKEVIKNKLFALENTSELCFTCHRIANCLNHIEENREISDKLFELMKENESPDL